MTATPFPAYLECLDGSFVSFERLVEPLMVVLEETQRGVLPPDVEDVNAAVLKETEQLTNESTHEFARWMTLFYNPALETACRAIEAALLEKWSSDARQ